MLYSFAIVFCTPSIAPMKFETGLSINPFFHHHHHHRTDKVVVVIGATGTGKSKLAIDLATHFPAEIVNSDRIQLYKNLDITINKITEEKRQGVLPHSEFTADDFVHHASSAIDSIVTRDRLPIVAGVSNSYIETLVNQLRYDFCFLWIDVSLPVLHSILCDRVDRAGALDEIHRLFDPRVDYTRGIRRAIEISELDRFLRTEDLADDRTKKKKKLLESIKTNNCLLADREIRKIRRLYGLWWRRMHRIDATAAFITSGEKAEEAWKWQVVNKSIRIVDNFLKDENHVIASSSPSRAVINARFPWQEVCNGIVG